MAVTTALYYAELALASLDQSKLGSTPAACQLQHAIDMLECAASERDFDGLVQFTVMAG